MMYEVFRIWDGEKPFSVPGDKDLVEHLQDMPKDGVDRFRDVTEPELHFYPASGRMPHPAALVCPGGGYDHITWSNEGVDIASMLNLNGISAFVLKYRCPGRRQAAHADAARAMRFIRANAERFGIMPDHVGGIGFSAGGHLIATISAPADTVPYPAQDAVDKLPWRTDFAVLVYPAYLVDDQMRPNPEFQITSETPPTLLIQAEDDFVNVENSLGWYLALKQAGVPAEMHLFDKGGHGYGLLRTGNPISNWGAIAGEWLRRKNNIA